MCRPGFSSDSDAACNRLQGSAGACGSCANFNASAVARAVTCSPGCANCTVDGCQECLPEYRQVVDGPIVDGTSNALTLAPMARHDATGGPAQGHHQLPNDRKGGELVLEFSNYFSYLRSKQISYRLTLPDGADAPTVAIS